MVKAEGTKRWKTVLLTIGATLFVLMLLSLSLSLFDGSKYGNVALIKIRGVITGDGASSWGEDTISSTKIVEFIESAEESSQIEAIVLEINSPGGSPVASDEIGTAIKKAKKPVVTVIREVGASGGYWIASASEHIIANKMSITGSIGVYSSFLEFSGLMEKYGVGYERVVGGENKDMGSPYLKLSEEKKKILQAKIDKVHTYFIQEIATNRNLSESKVREMATGEFFLGSEALELGLVDELGDKETAEKYLKDKYDIEDVDYVVYEQKKGLLEMLSGVISQGFFNVGEGIGTMFLKESITPYLLT
ncbi:signal peptide peptidase SppA [Candidatus Woesearchaeota archaeon]|nr:signal peptide peptidase SppA [Candidatus Woesearchaeota archaeon]